MSGLDRDWIERARRRAVAYGERAAVVILDDDGGGKRLQIVRESRLDGDEFRAFDGKILAVVDQDGWQW